MHSLSNVNFPKQIGNFYSLWLLISPLSVLDFSEGLDRIIDYTKDFFSSIEPSNTFRRKIVAIALKIPDSSCEHRQNFIHNFFPKLLALIPIIDLIFKLTIVMGKEPLLVLCIFSLIKIMPMPMQGG